MQYDVVESILRDILDAIPDGVYVTNAEREIVYWNEGAERITGYTSGDVLGSRCCDDILDHLDSHGAARCAPRAARSRPRSTRATHRTCARCTCAATTESVSACT